MVIEAGVAAGYVVAWAMRRARRATGRADVLIDTSIEAGMDKLAGVVQAKLGAHPALDDLAEEAATDDQQVSELTRQQVELALAAAARRDEDFGRTVTDLVAQLRAGEQASGGVSAVTRDGTAIFTGSAHAQASGNGIVFGQVAGNAHVNRGAADGHQPDPSEPGRSSH